MLGRMDCTDMLLGRRATCIAVNHISHPLQVDQMAGTVGAWVPRQAFSVHCPIERGAPAADECCSLKEEQNLQKYSHVSERAAPASCLLGVSGAGACLDQL